MALFDLFSKRMKRQRGDVPDVYRYEQLPQTLRVQIVQIWRDTLGENINAVDPGGTRPVREVYLEAVKILRKEHHCFSLNHWGNSEQYELELAEYLMKLEDVELALDVVEVIFAFIRSFEKDYRPHYGGPAQAPSDAIVELNARFKEHGVGYQFESGRLVRVDSQVLHAEVVKPALALLREEGFEGPNEEFLRAHAHHRHGRQEECLVDCLKAFESTMKVICEHRKWSYDKQKDTAAKLIGIIFEKGLLPDHVQSEMAALRSVLESGVPTVRNRSAGHGTGPTPRQVPGHVAAYALHLTAANIVFLVEAHKANPKK